MKIVSIVGARPQFIKLAPFSHEIRKHFSEVIVHTGQHYDNNMSEQFFMELELPKPDYNLEIGSSSHGIQTGKMLLQIEEILINEKPNMVVVFGDTNTTLAGALAAAKLNIRVVHIEAGLRSFNRSMPEEINRIVADHTSDFLFAPTKEAMLNLSKEGLSSRSFFTGDIMVDSLSRNLRRSLALSSIEKDLNLPDDFIVLTLHRPYNVDSPSSLVQILKKLSELNKTIVFPVHPRTRHVLESHKIKQPPSILITQPLGYLDFLRLQSLSSTVITDSGGIQKEAFLLKKPCVTLRSETEWIETVQSGWNILLDYRDVDFIEKVRSFNPTGSPPDTYGKNVAIKMVDIVRANCS